MNQSQEKGRIFLATGALLGLLSLTIGAAYISLGFFNIIASMGISVAKAAIIIMVFMKIRRQRPLIFVVLAVGMFWLGLLFILSISDFLTRP